MQSPTAKPRQAGRSQPIPTWNRGMYRPANALMAARRGFPGIIPESVPRKSREAATRVKAVVET